ncbi:hypothetical protein WFK94_01190 [Yersinia enterocolitica]
MKKIIILLSLVFISAYASAKTVSDFINERPALAKSPVIKAAIQQGAIGNAGLDALSNGATSDKLGSLTQRLLADNGYDYAKSALRELATTFCGEEGIADIYGLRERDCQVIINEDSVIE